MTLAVAHQDNKNLRLIADTRINDARSYASARNTIYDGKIKAIVIHPELALAYANHVEPAEEAIKQLFIDFRSMKNMPFTRPYEVLMHHHKGCNAETDFLICDGLQNKIFRIQNEQIEHTNGRWIGDLQGFEKYQEAIHSSSKTNLNKSMDDALKTVIHDTSVESVGGYSVLITNKEMHGFQYTENATLESVRARTIKFDSPGQMVAIPLGTEEEGTGSVFQYCGCSLKDNCLRATAFYTHGASEGLLFLPWLSLDPIRVEGTNGSSFIKRVKATYNVALNGFDRHGSSAVMRISSFT